MLAPETRPRPPTRPAQGSLITSPTRISIHSTSECLASRASCMHRPHIGIEVESLPQADINRAKAHSDRGRARSLERHAILADQLEGGGGQRVAGSLRSTKACFGWNPIDMRPGSANNLASSPR